MSAQAVMSVQAVMSGLIGIFGGTFDPVHLGHLNSIKLLEQSLAFEQIHWVLSARPPHKQAVTASTEHRYAMLQLALSDYARYVADDSEIERAQKSYTFDTVQQFKQRYPQNGLCLIIGADSLHKLHTWYRFQELLEQVHWVVLHRPGYTLEVPDYCQSRVANSFEQLSESDAGKLVLFPASDFDISSTRLRDAFSHGRSDKSSRQLIKQYIATPVADYIYQHKLYQANSLRTL